MGGSIKVVVVLSWFTANSSMNPVRLSSPFPLRKIEDGLYQKKAVRKIHFNNGPWMLSRVQTVKIFTAKKLVLMKM